ncbi:MAG: hypothetical protein M3442_06225 [Chloroflexota bacterium]|nr:hypothetical protein [Chloroflexota bacterium]
MPKRYEDEIRDLLRGMNEFPGEQRRRRRWAMPSLGVRPSWGHLDAQRIMGGALILMLFAWIMRGPWAFNYPWMVALAGYVSLLSIVLFVIALVMLVRGGAFGRGATSGETRWRGQVIELPRRGGLLSTLRAWWRRLTSRFTRGNPRRPGSRGRDSFQW